MRPSHKEINRKIQAAKVASTEKRILIINPLVIAADAIELGYPVEKICEVLLGLIDELQPGCYAGHRPPQCSYENCIKGLELFFF